MLVKSGADVSDVRKPPLGSRAAGVLREMRGAAHTQ